MIKIVCDTNILISAYVFPGGTTDEILSLVGLGELAMYLSPDIISEFKKVLSKKFKYSIEEVGVFVGRILEITTLVYPSERLKIVERVDADNRILECATASGADYIVTGDKRDLLPLKTIGQCKIVSPREFLQIIS